MDGIDFSELDRFFSFASHNPLISAGFACLILALLVLARQKMAKRADDPGYSVEPPPMGPGGSSGRREPSMIVPFVFAVTGIILLATGFSDCATVDRPFPESDTPQFEAQPPYGGDCRERPPGSVCLSFSDGYIWLINDSVRGWKEAGSWEGRRVEAAQGGKADYYHVLGTDLIKLVPKQPVSGKG